MSRMSKLCEKHLTGSAKCTIIRMSSEEKPPPGLTIDRAAFLLLRVKRAFKKKKQQRKEKSLISGENKGEIKSTGRPVENSGCCRPAPLLRSRTLPAIIVPGLSILQKQIDVCYTTSEIAGQTKVIQTAKKSSIDSSNIKANKLIKPRILFTDETMVGQTNPAIDNNVNKEKFVDNFGKNHRLSSSNVLNFSGSQPMIRLSKLLNQKANYSHPNDEISRRLSWDRRPDNNNTKPIDESWSNLSVHRSGSIDSFICCNDWNVINSNTKNTIPNNFYHWQKYGYGSDIRTEPCSPAPLRRSPSPSPSLTPCQTPTPLLKIRNDRQSLTSNIGKRIKGQRAITELQSFQGMEFLEGLGKKKHHQLNHQTNHLIVSTSTNPLSIQPSLNAHLHALFTAIENGQLDKVKTLLESGEIDINSVNNDGLSPLDVAVLNNNKPLMKMLVANGAQEGNQFRTPETLSSHLASLMLTAEHKLGEISGTGSPGTSATSFLEAPTTRGSFSATHNNLTGCGGNTEDKQVALWERRVRTLRKMLLGFDQARPPDVPFYISVDVVGIKSVLIRFQETDTTDSCICTKFKVQWSIKEDFSVITGEKEVFNMKQHECRIDGLIQGQRYYFRSSAGNLKGYSRFVPSSPTSVVPSSWRDIDGKQPRFAGRLEQLDSLFVDIKRPEYAQDTLALQRRNHKKKTTIKQLFSATSKFQKNLRRGVYFSCLFYHEDKVLVTNEDFLPVIEVDETYPSCIYNDFHWLMKVACTWDNVKTLRQDMEKSHGSSTNHFRLKLLQAAAQMQAALCIQDLGQLYHKPIRDIQGTLVISTVNYIKSPKLVSVLNSRWLPLNKITKKIIVHEESNVSDLLMSSIQEQMTYHQLSSIKLNRGLYLGYLKMQSSVDLIQVVVPAKAPNVLPHCKVRDNPHISAEEWNYLKKITRITRNTDKLDKEYYGYDEEEEQEEKENSTSISAITNTNTSVSSISNESQPSEQEKLFVDLIAATARRLFSYMEINHDDSLNHRLYDAEVIELTNDVSFLIIVPPAETACSVPGTREILLQRGDFLSIPIQVFEMVHLNAYQTDVINRYSKLSCILELDTAEAQHNHREAFSSLEMSVTKDKLTKLKNLQSQMNNVWKGARWLIDVITFARDRTSSSSSSSSSSQSLLTTSITTGISMKYLLNIERNSKTNGHSLKRTLLQLPPRDPKLVKSSPGRGSWPGPNLSSSTSNLLTAEFSKSEQQLPSGETVANNNTVDNDLVCINDHTRKGSDTSNLSTGSEPIKFSGLFLSDHLNKLPPSKSEDTLFISHYKINNASRNRSATVTSGSTNINQQLNVNPIMHGRSHTGLSTTNLTNTNSLLSFTSNNTSDSTQSLDNDDYRPLSDSNISVKSNLSTKCKISKPTASVAAMASTSPINTLDQLKDQKTSMSAPTPGILQVFAAYETGLASGTSLKLHVTPRTTAREVVDLVVKQLNMAVVLKGQDGPIYTNDELPNFCLVAVIGARERCLRDDFKPLQLQNPWKKGRLYVRLKQDVLAALEHSSKHTAYL